MYNAAHRTQMSKKDFGTLLFPNLAPDNARIQASRLLNGKTKKYAKQLLIRASELLGISVDKLLTL
jgi:hypothetical protein